MGCYPLRVIVSKALGKCNGRERWMEDQRMDYAMAYPPGPPTQTHYMQPVARTVAFSATNSVHIIPPSTSPPQQQQQPQPQAPPPQQHEPDHQQPEQPAPAPEQGAPPAEQQPKRKKKSSRRVRFGPEPPPQQQQEQQQQQQHQEQQQQQQQQEPEHAPNNNPARGSGPPWYSRYTPSPLPRWEATPRRHEYFSGEYRYSYPTPVREGIYSMATDANRLTTIFSEENPNACAIV